MLSLLGFLFLFIIFTLFSVVYWYWSKPSNLPPGPIGLPFIGSYLAFFGGDNAQTVLKEYAKTYGPIYQLYVLNKLVVVLADFDTIQEALVKQGDTFTGRPAFHLAVPSKLVGRGLIFSEGPLWREERHFALTTLRKFGLGRSTAETLIKAESEYLRKCLVDYAISGEPFNPHVMTTFAVANIIAQLLFGKRFSYDDDAPAEHFVAFTQRMSGAGVSMISPLVFSRTAWDLMKLTPEEKMHEEIKEQTGLALPGYGDRFEMPYTQAVITEIQRLSDVVPLGVTRRCMEPTTLLGYHIPEDAIVVPLLSNVLFNPDVFPDPHRFNPDRFLDASGNFINHPQVIPFQAGKRICLGEPLADMELFLFITGFVTSFRVFFPPHKPSPSLKPVAGVTCSPSPYEICIEMRGDWRDSIGC